MSSATGNSAISLKAAFAGGSAGNALTTRSKPKPKPPSPITLRLTVAERAKLEELAAGMTHSAYIRACVFAQEEKRRKARPRSVVADKQALAQVLGLLGESRIANNLNQLAYHANIGALMFDDVDRRKIDEAYDHVIAMRRDLLRALGKRL